MQLDVLDADRSDQLSQAFLVALRQRVRGAVRLSRHERLLYATDASIYQVEPLGVIEPVDEADVAAAVRTCAEFNVAVLPRGGGTSLAGQCTNAAMVIDLSPRFRRVVSVDLGRRVAVVEPGVTIDQLNRHLAAMDAKLFFAPDPATAAQASIGGCIGNNAAGTRSIKYARTSENVLGLRCVLSDGSAVGFGVSVDADASGAALRSAPAWEIQRSVAAIVREHALEIAARFPKTIRRNAGYGLDLILKQIDAGVADDALDLTGLICGSEGTLAIVTQATVRLHPLPARRGVALATFGSIDEAVAAVPAVNATGATAVELLDDVVLQAAAGNAECREYLKLVPSLHDGRPATGVLMIEYESLDAIDDLHRQFDQLESALAAGVPLVGGTPQTSAADANSEHGFQSTGTRGTQPEGQAAINVARFVDPADLAKIWALRKAAEPLLHSIGGGASGRAKPHTFVEDNAVPVERLGEFVAGFKQIVAKHQTEAAYYAHASVGVLHVRPLIDLHVPAERQKMTQIAVEVADLAKACGGVMSGEHGDGRIRGPLLLRFYGPTILRAFAQVKAVFDPQGLLNPGNIVGAGEVKTIAEQLRQDRQRLGDEIDRLDTFFDYSDQHGFGGAVEMCNGAGVCRKTAGGVMCPSYRGTLDERHATRGRGNALRLAITGQLSSDDRPAWDDAGTIDTLHLCLQCKACKSECPSNVDIARLKAEYTAQRYKQQGTPLSAKLLGHVRTLNQLGSIAPRLANAVARFGPVRAMMNRLLKLSPERLLPPFAKSLRSTFRPRLTESDRPAVVLYEDCFHGFNEPHIARDAVALLEHLGYRVLLPKVSCCGRAMISTGCVPDAVASATKALGVLSPLLSDPTVRAFVFLEPSCLSAIKDDWLTLKLPVPIGQRTALAARAMLVEEFVDAEWSQHPNTPTVKSRSALVYHGHCHQKAVWGQDRSVAALRRVADVTVLDTTCCGMAGSFGFTADRYDLSMAIGELSVFPQIRAHKGATVVAPGTSCRHQILDGVGRHAVHPVQALCDAFGLTAKTPRREVKVSDRQEGHATPRPKDTVGHLNG